jgi:hypothetical protein
MPSYCPLHGYAWCTCQFNIEYRRLTSRQVARDREAILARVAALRAVAQALFGWIP